MLGRAYIVSFYDVTVSAVQDLIALKSAANKALAVYRFWCKHNSGTLAAEQGVLFRCRRHTATFTLGSGGSTPTAYPVNQTDTAYAGTVHANDTTQASSGGTSTVLWADGCHLYQGLDVQLRRPITIGGAEGFTFELMSAVSGTVKLSGGVEFEEIG